jgi:hypothetical protein
MTVPGGSAGLFKPINGIQCAERLAMRASLHALFVILALAVAAAPGLAQGPTVTGIVIDARTEQPIGDVLVYVESQPAFTSTDSEGRFALALPAGTYSITASVIGYNWKTCAG